MLNIEDKNVKAAIENLDALHEELILGMIQMLDETIGKAPGYSALVVTCYDGDNNGHIVTPTCQKFDHPQLQRAQLSLIGAQLRQQNKTPLLVIYIGQVRRLDIEQLPGEDMKAAVERALADQKLTDETAIVALSCTHKTSVYMRSMQIDASGKVSGLGPPVKCEKSPLNIELRPLFDTYIAAAKRDMMQEAEREAVH